MRQRPLAVVLLVVILTLPMLGCVGTGSVGTSQETAEIEEPNAESLADCLAEMFPQISRGELERHAQMQMTDAGDTKNAEAFVEKFCADGVGAAQLTSTNIAMPTSATPASTNPSNPDLARGLGVTRAEMEHFFRTQIAANRTQPAPVTFAVAHRAGGSKITEAHWDGWGATSRRVRYGGTYAALSGPDKDLHGILFAYEGKPRDAATEFSAVAGRVRPEESSNRPKRALWVAQRVRGMTFGGGGGLSNILPSSRSTVPPLSIEEACSVEGRCFVHGGVEIIVTGIHGVVVMRIRAVDDNTTDE